MKDSPKRYHYHPSISDDGIGLVVTIIIGSFIESSQNTYMIFQFHVCSISIIQNIQNYTMFLACVHLRKLSQP